MMHIIIYIDTGSAKWWLSAMTVEEADLCWQSQTGVNSLPAGKATPLPASPSTCPMWSPALQPLHDPPPTRTTSCTVGQISSGCPSYIVYIFADIMCTAICLAWSTNITMNVSACLRWWINTNQQNECHPIQVAILFTGCTSVALSNFTLMSLMALVLLFIMQWAKFF